MDQPQYFYKKSFSIHSPLAGRDAQAYMDSVRQTTHFQSTRPLRGETSTLPREIRENHLFSIHSPLAGRDSTGIAPIRALLDFQSTRPLRGETQIAQFALGCCCTFQSTRPLRGETALDMTQTEFAQIFNPLAPCGARLMCAIVRVALGFFQSTRPLRGETF